MLYPSAPLGTSPLDFGASPRLRSGHRPSTFRHRSLRHRSVQRNTSLRSLRHRSVQRGTAVLDWETWVNEIQYGWSPGDTVTRLILYAFSCTIVFALLSGCEPATNDITVSEARTSSCNTCHDYPGTEACREDFVSVRGIQTTKCYQCHARSVVLDSQLIEIESAKVFAYHDAQDTTPGRSQPMLSSAHANGIVDLDPGACNVCHGFPPADRERRDLRQDSDIEPEGHYYHTVDHKYSCYLCHDTAVHHEIDTIHFKIRNTSFYDGKQVYYEIAAQILPAVKPTVHNNGIVDVSFFKRINENTDTTYLWDPLTRSCSNIGCHTRPELYERTYWK